MKRGTKIYLTSLVLAFTLPFILFSDKLHKKISDSTAPVRHFFTFDSDKGVDKSALSDLLIAVKGRQSELGYFEMDEKGRAYALPIIQKYSATKSFYIGDFALTKTKITNKQYERYLINTDQAAQKLPDDDSSSSPPDDAPAEVTYAQAESYCRWFGEQVGQKAGLPSRNEWEYSARNGGKRVLFPTDNGLIDIGRNVASKAQKMAVNSTGSSLDQPLMSVGQFPPTPLGFYDMASNGFEWTATDRDGTFITSQAISMEGGAATITYHPDEDLKGRNTFRCATWPESQE